MTSILNSRPGYRPDLDGLRAIAIVGVVLYHAEIRRIPGGFLGVDIFFVLSGFLISGLIFDAQARGNYSLSEFYARRIRRIFPALAVVLPAVLFLGWLVLLPDEFEQLGRYVVAGGTFVVNLLALHETGYFDNAATTKPLLHLWSLAVEEQFYILWPWLLILLGPRPHWLPKVLGAITLLSLGLDLIWIDTQPERAFYLPVTRLWELSLGGWVAAALRDRVLGDRLRGPIARPRVALILSILGLLAIVTALLGLNRSSAVPGWPTLLPTLGTALLLLTPSSPVNRWLLANRVAVWIGLISYPLYLWHWPLISFAHVLDGTVSLQLKVKVVVASVLLAWVTTLWIERRLRFGGRSRQKVIGLVVAMVGIAGLGGAAWGGWFHPRLDLPEVEPFVTSRRDWKYPPGRSIIEKYQERLIYRIPGGVDGEVLYFGDSNMEQYAPRIARLAEIRHGEAMTAVFLTRSACAVIPGVATILKDDCLGLADTALDYMHTHPVKRVVVVGRWQTRLFSDTRYYFVDGKQRWSLSEMEGTRRALASLVQMLRDFKQAGVEVTIVQSIPTANMEIRPRFMTLRTSWNPQAATANLEKASFVDRGKVVDQRTRDAIAESAQLAGVAVIDPIPSLCDDAVCRLLTDKGRFIYRDGAHLAASYVERYVTYLDDTLLARPTSGAGGS